jgi:hypothetical protein
VRSISLCKKKKLTCGVFDLREKNREEKKKHENR